jgi:hypothetical protein
MPESLWEAIQRQKGQGSKKSKSPGTSAEFFMNRKQRANQQRAEQEQAAAAAAAEAAEEEQRRAAGILASLKAREKLNMGRGFRGKTQKVPLLPGQVNNMGNSPAAAGKNAAWLNLEEHTPLPEEMPNLLPPLKEARQMKPNVWNNHNWENAINRGIESERQKAGNTRRRKSRKNKKRKTRNSRR